MFAVFVKLKSNSFYFTPFFIEMSDNHRTCASGSEPSPATLPPPLPPSALPLLLERSIPMLPLDPPMPPEPLFPHIRPPESPPFLIRSPFRSPPLSPELPFYPLFSPESISQHMLTFTTYIEKNALLKYAHINALFDLFRGCNYIYKHFQLAMETSNLETALKNNDIIKGIDVVLNDDCILEIFKWLDIRGLIYAAIYNNRLKELAKYERKRLDLTLTLHNKNIELCRLIYLLGPLEFGRSIEEISITFTDSESYCCAVDIVGIVELLASLIGRQLRRFVIKVQSMHRADCEYILECVGEIQTFEFHVIVRN